LIRNIYKTAHKVLLRAFSLAEKNYIITSALWPLFLLLYAFFTTPPDLSNRVITGFLPDQVEYHSCAVNHVSGYGFMRGGNVNDRLDYKLEFSDDKALLQHEVMAGMKRLDKFPGVSLFLAAIYKVFGINPAAAKIFMLILFILFLFTIPVLTHNLWGKKGFWAGFTAVFFLFFYLLQYTAILTADLVSVFFNFYIIFFYIKSRQHFVFKYIIPLALLSGISILFKPSLMFFMVFMFADLFILSVKDKKHKLIRFFVLVVLFFSTWAPYNLWSILQSRKIINNAQIIIKAISRENPDTAHINFLSNTLKESFLIETNKIEIDTSHINYYKSNIKPVFDLKRNISLNEIAGYSKELKFISFLRVIAEIRPYYFMVQLIPTVGAFELHNEYISDGFYYNAWHTKEDSYYNNDKLSHKSDMYRMFSFYYNNPKYIFTNAHSKLTRYFENNAHIPLLIVFTLLFLALKSVMRRSRNPKNYVITVFAVVLLTAHFLTFEFLPYILLCIIILSKFDEVLKNYISLPIIFVLISFYLFPIITYGNSRFMIYYDTYLFILLGIVAVELLSLLNNYFNKVILQNESNTP